MIKLRRRLIILCRPVFAAVDADGCPAIVRVDHPIRIVGIDPQSVMVAMRRVQAIKRFSAVNGAIQPGICRVNRVGILGVGPNMREIPRALPETVIVINQGPVLPAIVAAIQAALFCFDQRIDNIRIAARDGNADAAKRAFRKTIPSERASRSCHHRQTGTSRSFRLRCLATTASGSLPTSRQTAHADFADQKRCRCRRCDR